ncbi:MAG: host attachment protein [Pseudomonadota bacterium]
MKNATPVVAPGRGAERPLTWVAIAAAGDAAVYAVAADRRMAVPQFRLRDETARSSERDLGTDRPGRTFDRFGHGRHAVANGDRDDDERRQRFARRIGQRLDEGRRRGDYDRLVIVATPALLGALRRLLPAPTRATIVREVSRNLADTDLGTAGPDTLRELVPGALETPE